MTVEQADLNMLCLNSGAERNRCQYRIQEPTMREIRYLDKLVDELAKGKALGKILRT